MGLEGGHSARRIVHAGGSETGRAITRRLSEIVAETEGLTVIEETSALSLWSDGERCGGLVTDRGPLAATATILATGRRRGAVAAHDQPLGSDRRRAASSPTPPAPTSAISSSASSTQPPWRFPAASTTAS